MELTRYCVLIVALLKSVLEKVKLDVGDEAILQELDALTILLAERSRSAVDYHLTARGKANLEVAEQLAEQLEGADQVAELEHKRWSNNQAAQGAYKPTDRPEETVKRRVRTSGVRLLSKPTKKPRGK